MAFLIAAASTEAQAQTPLYVTTGQTGAQTQIDTGHTTTVYLSVTGPIVFGGANLTIKTGSATTANISFKVWAGAACSGTPLGSVTLTPANVTGQFTPTYFNFATPLTLAPGTYCANITSPATDAQANAYFIKGTDTCSILPAGTASCSFFLASSTSPVLTIAKSQPSPALTIGTNSTYTMTVTNGGGGSATTAQVKDQLPTGMTYVSGGGSGWTCSNASGLVTCNFSGTIAAGGSSSFPIVVKPTASIGGQSVTNYASIDSSGGTSPPTPGAGCSPLLSCASASSTVTAAPLLAVAKSQPSPALAVGSNSTYTLTVTNTGSGAATTAQVKDQLPTGMTYVSGGGSGWTCTNASGLVTCNFSGTIAATSGTSSFPIVVTPTVSLAGQTITNYASIDPTGGTSPPAPGSSCSPAASCASSSSPVAAAPSPLLSVAKSQPSPALTVGTNSTYTLTVTNTGSAAATTAQVQDQLPTGMTYVSGGGSGWTCSNASGLVTCNFSGTITATSGTSSFPIVVTPTVALAGQTVTNYASIDPTGGSSPPAPGPSCSPAASCASTSSPVAATAAPLLAVAKSQPSPALTVGSNSTYTLTVTNTGAAAATTAQVLDQLPTSMTYVSGGGSGWTCTNASGLVTCNYSGTIAAASGTSSFPIVVTPTVALAGQTITNYASIDPTGGSSPPTPGSSCSPAASCASTSSPVAAAPAPLLAVAKSQPSPGLLVGANSTYTLTVTNTGNAATTTAQVKDQLPTGMTYVSGGGSGWTCTNASGLVTCNYSGSIAATNGTSSFPIVVTPTVALAGQSATNYASVDPTGGSSAPAPGPSCSPAASCTSASSLTSAPNLKIGLSPPAPGLAPGKNSTYTVTVTNTGTASSPTAQIKVDLPPDLTFVSAGTTGWTCSITGTIVTCDYTGTLAAGGGAVSMPIVVTTNPNVGNQPIKVYSSVDPTGGTSPAAPGPTCTGATTCADTASQIAVSKKRTEAVVQNFIASRGDRIASNGISLNRLIDRLDEEGEDDSPCGNGSLKDVPPMKAGAPMTAIRSGMGSPAAVPASADRSGTAADATVAAAEGANGADATQTGQGIGIGPTGAGTEAGGHIAFSTSMQDLSGRFGAERSGLGLNDPRQGECAGRKSRRRFDVWIDGTYEWLGGPQSSGYFGLVKIGADYRVRPGLLIGVMAQFDTASDKSLSLGYIAKGTGWMAGPYAAVRLAPGVMLDGRTLWGTSQNEVQPDMTSTEKFSTDRFLASARLSGQWKWNGVRFIPSVEYVHFEDKSRAFTDSFGQYIASQSVTIDRLLFGPEVRYGQALNQRLTGEGFLSVKGLWDLNPIALKSLDGATPDTHRSELHVRFDAGFSLQDKVGNSATLGVGYEGLGGDGHHATSLTGRVRMPLD